MLSVPHHASPTTTPTPTPASSLAKPQVCESMPLQYFVQYFACKIYENFLVLTMWIISILPLCSYEKCRIRIFDINCGQNFILQSFSMLITAYYSVRFPYLLTLLIETLAMPFNFQPTFFRVKMQYNRPCNRNYKRSLRILLRFLS